MSFVVDPIYGCRLFQGHLDAKGYGRIGTRKAHIVQWEDEHGPVPEGFELDHQCRRRHCVATHHTEPVTRAENEKRKSLAYRLKRKTCPKGHDMQTNRVVVVETGGVVCRTCNREALENRK